MQGLKNLFGGGKKEKPDSRHIFGEMPPGRALATMAVPSIVGQLIVLIYNLADTYFIGQTLDPLKVAGVSLILPVHNICIALTVLSGTGAGTRVAYLLGKGKLEEAKKASSFGVMVAFLISLTFSLGVFAGMDALLPLLGADGENGLYARQYVTCVVVLGGVPTVLSGVLAALLRSDGYSREASVGITGGGLLNIALDPLFMYVLLPEGMEILGVGLATLTSNCCSFLFFLFVIARNRKKSVIRVLPAGGMPEKATAAAIVALGLPAMLGTLLFDVDYMVLDKLMVNGYGNDALAAIGIVLKAERLPLNVGIGICQGMIPIIAFNYSAKNYTRMDVVSRLAKRAGLIVGALSVLLYELFAPQILHFFIPGAPATEEMGAFFLRLRCLATPLMFLSFFCTHLFQCYGESRTAGLLGIGRWAVFNIPMLFLLNALLGSTGLVLSQLSADILNVTLSFVLYKRYRRRHLPETFLPFWEKKEKKAT